MSNNNSDNIESTKSDINLKTKLKKTQKYTLDELVEQITPENRYQEIDSGFPVGKEIW